MKTQRYLIEAFDGGSGVHGPYTTEVARLSAAKSIHQQTAGDSECSRLTIGRTGKPTLEPIPAEELN